MTLFRKIATVVSLVFVVLLIGTMWNDFRYTSRILEGQLKSAANNMATTLGVAIANSGQGTDPAFVETLFNVAFDSGHLSQIELLAPTGEQLHIKQQEISIRNVPDWLIELAPIKAASGESRIMKNWIPYGTIRLTLHPGYAYAGLYDNLKSLMIWFGMLSVAGLTILWGMLHLLLRPLRTIREQADAIVDNRFIQNEHVPRTLELRSVTLAMNRMVRKVQDIFAEQAASLNEYHNQLYRDPVTGLGNRRQLLAELDELCRDDAHRRGCLVVLHVHGLNQFRERTGYKGADELLLFLAGLLEGAAGKQARQLCARMNDAEFAMHVHGDTNSARILTQTIFDAFSTMTRQRGIDDLVWLFGGLAPLRADSNTGAILSDVDFALAQAESSGNYAIYGEMQNDLALPHGKMQWRAWLEDCIEQKLFFLVSQPAQTPDGKHSHEEIFVRLHDDQGREVPAGVFMPMANSLDLDYAIETEVFRMMLNTIRHSSNRTFAINISSTFLEDANALASLEQFMREWMRIGRIPLQIEASHFSLVQHPQAAAAVAERIRQIGCRLGVDNLDLSLPMDLLQALRPNYVKVNARTLMDMMDGAGIQNLRSLARGLDIQLCAVGIDSQDTLDTMLNSKLDAVQGNHIGKPRALA